MSFAGAPLAALAAFLLLQTAQRVHELWLSARHARRLAARGGIEQAAGTFPLFVVLHVVWPLAMVAEVLFAGARPPAVWPAWLAVWLAAQGLRAWAQVALGEHWTVQVWVVPGEPLVTRGPYRWLPHPNYLAVVVELLAAPLIFGAWRTAIAASLLNALALSLRIPAEERALGRRGPPPSRSHAARS